MAYTTLPKSEIERILDNHEEWVAWLNAEDVRNPDGTYNFNANNVKYKNAHPAKFMSIDLSGYDFSGRKLDGITFKWCDLTNAKFKNCKFSKSTYFERNKLDGADFTGSTNLDKVNATENDKKYLLKFAGKRPEIKLTDKEVCKDWGVANNWDDDTTDKFRVAAKRHEQMMKAHPSAHDYHEDRLGRGYSEYKCKCGFKFAEDYSD